MTRQYLAKTELDYLGAGLPAATQLHNTHSTETWWRKRECRLGRKQFLATSIIAFPLRLALLCSAAPLPLCQSAHPPHCSSVSLHLSIDRSIYLSPVQCDAAVWPRRVLAAAARVRSPPTPPLSLSPPLDLSLSPPRGRRVVRARAQ